MAYTLKQLRDKIIIDAGIEGSADFPIARLNEMINIGQRFVQTELNGLGLKKWESSASLTLADGTFGGTNVSTSALPTGLAEGPKSIKYINTLSAASGGTNGVAMEVDDTTFIRRAGNTYRTPTNAEPIFIRVGSAINIAPRMTASGSPTATIYYHKIVTDLSLDNDATEIPNEFIDYVIKKVVAEIEYLTKKIASVEMATAGIKTDIRNAYEKYISKLNSTGIVASQDNAKLQ